MVQALGFGEHQYLIAAHDGKEHFHVHVMLNPVHPETAKVHSPRVTQRTLHRLARELEHKFGWAEADGLYRWDRQRNEPVRNTKAELSQIRDQRERSPGKQPAQMAKQDHFRDEQSLKVFASKRPAETLRKLLAGEANWQSVHLALSQHGVTIQKAENGGYTVGVEGSEVRAKVSDVFRFAFSGRESRARTEALAMRLNSLPPARYESGSRPTRTDTPLLDVPQSVDVVTRSLLTEQDARTLNDALVDVSGVMPTKPEEALFTQPVVRGFRAEVYRDGLPTYGLTQTAVGPTSLVGAERIEW